MRNRHHGVNPAEETTPNLPTARQKAPGGAEGAVEVEPVEPAKPAASGSARPVRAGAGEPFHLGMLGDGRLDPLWDQIETRPGMPSEAGERVQRLEALIHREVAQLRRLGAESVAVVIRPDANTELLVSLHQRAGHIEASVRCDRGDLADLQGHWRQLQESLAHYNVRLPALSETVPSQPEPSPGSGSRMFFSDDRASRHHEPPPERSSEPRTEKGASHEDAPRTTTPRSNPRPARRGGWEFWA